MLEVVSYPVPTETYKALKPQEVGTNNLILSLWY